ncbi:hypothetical protein [Amycolatopsis sacchari]|uniref:hypothetical protein n=1 Tax=Amycolatopsis sacchari TaxID=115433 RepID=UPI003D75653F
MSLHKARLARFPHVLWVDALADTRDEGIVPCRRCTAAAGGRGGTRRWTRVNPRS